MSSLPSPVLPYLLYYCPKDPLLFLMVLDDFDRVRSLVYHSKYHFQPIEQTKVFFLWF